MTLHSETIKLIQEENPNLFTSHLGLFLRAIYILSYPDNWDIALEFTQKINSGNPWIHKAKLLRSDYADNEDLRYNIYATEKTLGFVPDLWGVEINSQDELDITLVEVEHNHPVSDQKRERISHQNDCFSQINYKLFCCSTKEKIIYPVPLPHPLYSKWPGYYPNGSRFYENHNERTIPHGTIIM